APDEFDRRGQLGGVAAAARSRQRALGVAHDRAGDAQEILVELLHLRLAPRADRRGRARAGRATALGDLEDPARPAARALADALPVKPAERAINQAPPDLALTLIESPIGQMLEDEHPQHDGGRRTQSAPALTLGMALRQRLRHTIDEDVVVEQRVDLPKRRVP